MAKNDLWQRLNSEVSLANVKALITGQPVEESTDTVDMQAEEIMAYAAKEAKQRGKRVETVLAELGFNLPQTSPAPAPAHAESEGGFLGSTWAPPPAMAPPPVIVSAAPSPPPSGQPHSSATPASAVYTVPMYAAPSAAPPPSGPSGLSGPPPAPAAPPAAPPAPPQDSQAIIAQEWLAALLPQLAPLSASEAGALLAGLSAQGGALDRLLCLYPELAQKARAAAGAEGPFWLALLQQGVPPAALVDLLRCDASFAPPADEAALTALCERAGLQRASIPSRKPPRALRSSVPDEWFRAFALAPLRKTEKATVLVLPFVPTERMLQGLEAQMGRRPQVQLASADEVERLRAHYQGAPEAPAARPAAPAAPQAAPAAVPVQAPPPAFVPAPTPPPAFVPAPTPVPAYGQAFTPAPTPVPAYGQAFAPAPTPAPAYGQPFAPAPPAYGAAGPGQGPGHGHGHGQGQGQGQQHAEAQTLKASLPSLRYGSAVEMVDRLLSLALQTRATDIHIEPAERGARIRFRIDGICHEVTRVEPEQFTEIVARIKILADLDVTERRRPQDGHIHARIQGSDHDLRVATVPARGGEKVGLRIANTGRISMRLDQLGLMHTELAVLRDVASLPFGMILATGPVGSGKTTTLYSCLNEVDRTQRHVMSIEDPIEFTLEGANHVEVNYALGFDFVHGLRALLRQDPDTILIGEIRDEETARIAVRASMTGLMVYSTLHANDAVGAITTLRNFHIPPHLIASALRGVVAQRLLRKICERCRVPHRLRPGDAHSLGLAELPEGLRAFRGAGCPACLHTGYTGRTGVFEIFRVDETVRNLILDEASERDIRAYTVSQGMRSLQQDGLQKIHDGITSIEEFHRVLRF